MADEISVTPSDSINDNINNIDPQSIMIFSVGRFNISETIVVNKSIILKGAKYNIDARGRSSVGIGLEPHTGLDPAETTLWGEANVDIIF
jgi:hypothetical protein